MSGLGLDVGNVGARENLAVAESSITALVVAVCHMIVPCTG